jgi:hypothetical protein
VVPCQPRGKLDLGVSVSIAVNLGTSLLLPSSTCIYKIYKLMSKFCFIERPGLGCFVQYTPLNVGSVALFCYPLDIFLKVRRPPSCRRPKVRLAALHIQRVRGRRAVILDFECRGLKFQILIRLSTFDAAGTGDQKHTRLF